MNSITESVRQAERAADEWIGNYTWAQQAGLPPDLNRILRAMWIHGYRAGLEANPEAQVQAAEALQKELDSNRLL